MKKSRIIPWLTVLLYIASTLGIAAFAEEGEEWFEDLPAAAETVAAGSSEPAEQPPQKPSGSDRPQSGEHDASPEAADGQQAEKQQSGNPPEPAGEPAYRPDESDEPSSGGNEPQPTENLPVYNVQFITPGGRVFHSYEATAGTAVEEPPLTPALKGRQFSHWYQVGTNPNTPFHFGGPLEEDLTLAAFFSQAKAEPETSAPVTGEDPEGEAAPEDEEPADENPEDVNLEDEDLDDEDLEDEDLEDEGLEDEDLEDEDLEDEDLEDEDLEDEGLEDEDLEDDDLEDEGDFPPIQVNITSDAGTAVRLGDRVTLTAHVSNQLEGEPFSMWRYNAGDGWVVAATNTRTHSFVVSEENHRWMWEFKISVLVDGED